jgi:hemolysin activation/secretion protein
MQSESHLTLEILNLPASAEWKMGPQGWCLVRLSQGVAYCFGPLQTEELGLGEIVVVPPQGSALFRASQLGPVQLNYFHFRPELLACLLTLSERYSLATLAETSAGKSWRLPATHAVAKQYAEVGEAVARENRLLERCSLLSLVATLLAPSVKASPLREDASPSAPKRFLEMVQKLSETELLSLSHTELAHRCGCSLRHFSRLFRAHFGVSIRTRQTLLRLQKARQLLCETDAKVINIALDSGYRHLGLFNAMFKKHFGVTPTQLRRSKQKKSRSRSKVQALVLLISVLPITFRAVAEEVKPESKPEVQKTAGTNGPSFLVKGYAIQGNTLLDREELSRIFTDYTGPAVTFDTIRKALAELQLAYRGRGYITVNVSLPQQQLTNGIVKVRVTEGRLADIQISGNHYYSSNNIMSALPSLQTNMLLNSLVLQQELDKANSSKDRQIYPEVAPGPEPGTTALRLKVKDRLPLHARAELNNYSTPGTPELRFNTAAQYNNLWQLDHQLGVQYAFSPEQYKETDTFPYFWDKPLIANYSAFYRLPLNGFTGVPDRRDFNIGDFGYDEVTRRFHAPPLTGTPEMTFYASRSDSDTGKVLQSNTLTPPTVDPVNGGFQLSSQIFSQTHSVNSDVGFRISDPFPPIPGWSGNGAAGLDYKAFKSTLLQTSINQPFNYVPDGNGVLIKTPLGPPLIKDQTLRSSVNYLPFAAGFDLVHPDKWGVAVFNFNNSFNFSKIFGNEDEFRKVAGSPKATGNYYVANLGLNREQKIYGDLGMRLTADGQWANQPLINNEQFAMGGNATVRGYRDGQEYGDTAWHITAEPHTDLLNLGMVDGTKPMLVRFSIFTDYGRLYRLAPPTGVRQSLSMWGAGFAFTGTIGEVMDFRFTFGMPLLDVPTVKAGTPRITFNVGMQF